MSGPVENAVAGEVRSTCPYCGVGCGVRIAHAAGRITAVAGDAAHPANFGRLCSKGLALAETVSASMRLVTPELRRSRSAPRTNVSWDEALDHVADRFADTIARHGPDSVAFYLSGQFLTEDYYAFNKLAKGLIGTNNLDTNSRLCMSSAVAGYKATLGSDAPPACYEDLDHADCVFIAGSNTAFAHPILYRRLEEARARHPVTVIVADPRRTDTAAEGDLHLQLAPGSDVALFNAMLHVMLAEGRVDRAFIEASTEAFEDIARAVAPCTPEWAAAICELPAADIVRAARLFASAQATLSLYCQGLNQSTSGTAKNAALINLHLATGHIGRAGAGPLSLTGQPNAMGGREVGGMANLMSAHRSLADPADRAEIARFWGVDSVPAKPGLTAVELFDALAQGSVKCVWIACTNPAQSMPDQAVVRAALARAELVVVEDCWRDIETAAFADVLLPAATWGEKDGTVTNSERRISRVRAAVRPPGLARADWQIAVDFAHRLGARLGRDAGRMFQWREAGEVFAEHCETTRGRDLDITGLSYARLEALGPLQWPVPDADACGTARLYTDGRYPTRSGRARFVVTPYRSTAEDTDARHPLRLNTGRLRDQWHGMSRTGRAASLHRHEPEPVLSMHPLDLAARGIGDGTLVRIANDRGALAVRARASAEVRRGDVFLPMHWGARWLAGDGINALTTRAYDPSSFQPELKHAAVAVASLEAPYEVTAFGILPDPDRALAALGELFARFDHASCGMAGRSYPVVVFRAAAAQPIADTTIAALDATFGLAPPSITLSYEDAALRVGRVARCLGKRLAAVRILGEPTGAAWLLDWIAEGRPCTEFGFALLAPAESSPAGGANRGRILCTCHDVAEADVARAFGDGLAYDEVRAALRCGTGCGSCVPAIKRLEAARTVAA